MVSYMQHYRGNDALVNHFYGTYSQGGNPLMSQESNDLSQLANMSQVAPLSCKFEQIKCIFRIHRASQVKEAQDETYMNLFKLIMPSITCLRLS